MVRFPRGRVKSGRSLNQIRRSVLAVALVILGPMVARMDAQFTQAYEAAFTRVRPETVCAAADAVGALVAEIGPGCLPPSQENP